MNLAFKKITPQGEEEFDDFYVPNVEFQGNDSAPLTVRTETGYTADPPQSRAQMLQHEQFQDLRVVCEMPSLWVKNGRT